LDAVGTRAQTNHVNLELLVQAEATANEDKACDRRDRSAFVTRAMTTLVVLPLMVLAALYGLVAAAILKVWELCASD